MNIRSALLAASLLALPAAGAMAQPINGVYVGLGAGFNFTQDIKIKNTGGGRLEGEGGPAVVGSVGYGFGNGLRIELEANYRGNHYKLQRVPGFGGGGDSDTYGAMVNGLYDFNLGPVMPYVGAGVGYEFTQLHNAHAYAPGVQINMNRDFEGSLAAQGIAGVAIPVGVPGLAITAEYRFLATLENQKFKGGGFVGAVPVSVSAKVGNVYDHTALIGIRYNFGAAPPPPPPAPAPVAAPAPAPARTYLVFFDWDKANLTDRARQIIAEAAQNSTRVQYTRIEVSGHADKTGSHAYNQRLSMRRAQNVAAELVRDGVPQNAIDIHAYGDTRPLVPTAEGVREPQNRRVEIVLQ